MDAMKIIYGLMLIDVALIVFIGVLLLIMPENMECAPGDAECLSRLSELRRLCHPSRTIVTVGNSTNYMKILVIVYWDGQKCVSDETVIEDHMSGVAPFDISGYRTICNTTPELLEKYGEHACNGSLLGFFSPDGSSDYGGSGETGGDDYVYRAYCSLEADDCKEEVSDYIKNCRPADILMDMEINNSQGGASYWTLAIQIQRLPAEYTSTKKLQPRCEIYHELVNAVNLPPEIPPHVIGDTMTCTIPLSDFPIGSVSLRWCEGELVEYIQMIYP